MLAFISTGLIHSKSRFYLLRLISMILATPLIAHGYLPVRLGLAPESCQYQIRLELKQTDIFDC